MVVDHAGSLHVGIHDRGTDEMEAATDQVLAERLSRGRLGGDLGEAAPGVVQRRAADEAPDVGVEAAELLLDCQEGWAFSMEAATLRRLRTMPGSASSVASFASS